MTILKRILFIFVLLLGFGTVITPAGTASAASAACPSGYTLMSGSKTVCCPTGATSTGTNCVTAGIVSCPSGQLLLTGSKTVCCPAGTEDDATDCTFAKYINPIVKLLSIAAGVAVVIGIIVGGIQYGASAGDPQKAAKAKGQISKALFGLIGFLFLYSALQFFSPGGISSNSVPTGSGTVAEQCSKTFLGLKPWFAYLSDGPNGPNKPDSTFESGTCNIQNFSLLGNSGADSQLLPVLLAVADDLVRIAGFVAVAFVITGGIQYVTSNGEPDKTKRARETIINALVGVVVAIIAASVVSFIGGRLSA